MIVSKAVLAGALAASMLAAPLGSAFAKPGGCLKYGAAGALAGHAVHHGVKGFMAGCAAGMIRRHYYKKQIKAQKKAGQLAPAAPAPAGTVPAPAN